MTDAAADGEVLGRTNTKIKRLRRLVSKRKARFEERAFVVEGPLVVTEALRAAGHASSAATAGSARSGLVIEAVFVERGHGPDVVAMATDAGLTVHTVADGVLAAVLDTVTPQLVAAVVSRPNTGLADLGPTGLVMTVVDGRDPGNIGTLVRSAEAAGAAGLVLAGSSVDPTNPKVLRASAGAALRLPVVVETDVDRALDGLMASGRALLATVIDPEATPYDEADLGDAAVVVGNESRGLPPEVLAKADGLVTIPLAGPTESLNLGVAGSIICFEALRQRRHRPDWP